MSVVSGKKSTTVNILSGKEKIANTFNNNKDRFKTCSSVVVNDKNGWFFVIIQKWINMKIEIFKILKTLWAF